MPRFIELLHRFRRDDRGVFAVFFAIIALVLIATSGAVVDFTSIQQTRTRAQTALDAAALALQPRITTDNVATLKTKAQALLTERLADASITAVVGNPVVNTTEGTLELTASVSKGTIFVRMVGITTLSANILSQATRKQLDLEVAMVLDNSGSMTTTMSNGSSRMTNLKRAARCATDILFNSITACDDTTLNNSDGLTPTNANVKVGISPFTEFVNVGTANKTATWMDQTGAAPVSKMGFDNDDNDANTFSANVNRFSLYTALGITWEGCVEARNHTTGTGGYYYDTQDLEPSTGTPDSLYVPTFAQDQADGYDDSYINDRPSACTNKDQGSWLKVVTKTSCTSQASDSSGFNNLSCGNSNTALTQKDQNGNSVTAASTEPASINGQPKVCTDAYDSSRTSRNPSRYTVVYTRSCSYSFSDRELHERLCKYVSGNTVSSLSSGPGGRTGPNADCGIALQPLTPTKSSIISKITAMAAGGGTNIHQGVVWGYNMLSPTAPLTEAKSFTSTTTKVMIVMTDGENTHSWTNDYAGADWYTAYGYPYTGRLTGASTAALQTEMDNRTKTTCTNAKDKGIEIFTIGLSPPNQTTIDMLTNCATDSSHAYFPTTAASLVSTFQAIAGQLADLRLAK